MARLGLGERWHCLMANDIDAKKAQTYAANFGGGDFKLEDVFNLRPDEMPGSPTLAWASFPCQDLSLAGNGNGLSGERSGAFWGFWSAIQKLKNQNRAPAILVLENVCGMLTSNGGLDFQEVCGALASLDYDFGAVVADAVHFLPQSRPRLFLICIARGAEAQVDLSATGPVFPWHTPALQSAVGNLPRHIASRWRWWRLPTPPLKKSEIQELLEDDCKITKWHTAEETSKLLAMMSETNMAKVNAAARLKVRQIGAVYKRTRSEFGKRVQRAEVRFDGIAGCLRTPGGGSSRQTLLIVEGDRVRSRLLTVREAARLMGVPDSYAVPSNYNDGYHVFGDGLAVPVVAYLREHLLDPISENLALPNKPALVAAE